VAKFTVYFNKKVINSQIVESTFIHIGRDKSNDLIIDNLAVAPIHGVITVQGNEGSIKQVDTEYPIYVNDKKIEQSVVFQYNDKITIGKYVVVMNQTEFVTPLPTNDSPQDTTIEAEKSLLKASLQILSGQRIGCLMPLKKAMTRLDNGESGAVSISRRKEGFFIYSLENDGTEARVNQEALADKTILLKDNDKLTINNISMQFFLEN
jgi:nitrogen fixation protein